MSKILITGSAGLVGSEAMRFFQEKGWETVGVDNNMRAYLFGTPKQKVEDSIDIRDQFQMDKIFRTHKFDAIIHAAAQPSHDWAKNDPLMDLDINARATLILLELTRKYCPEAVFIHVSTDKVYGENMGANFLDDRGELLRKEDREHPTRVGSYLSTEGYDEKLGLDFAGKRSLFGCSKTAADIYVQEYGNYFGLKTACFRCGCITGKQHQGAEYHGFLAYLVKCIKEGIPYKIFGFRGKQVRDQIHAYDLVNAFYHFIQNPRVGEVYNMGGGPERSVSILEAAELISNHLPGIDIGDGITKRKEMKLQLVDEPRKGDRIWDVHDVSKFRSHFPTWTYKYSLQDIIKDLCS